MVPSACADEPVADAAVDAAVPDAHDTAASAGDDAKTLDVGKGSVDAGQPRAADVPAAPDDAGAAPTDTTTEPPDPCVDKPDNAPCDDGDPCTLGDYCKAAKCRKGKQKQDCDDGDPCTEDGCHHELSCWHELSAKACDDGNPCTYDGCDSKAGCNNKPANPGDPCAVNECMIGQKCSASLLCLGGQARVCDDDSPCTDDSCNPAIGCVFKLNAKPCADGHACTIDDTCNGGACVGKKTNTCPSCNNTFGPWAGQLNKVLLGTDGTTGNGIDIDNNKKTCAPPGSCHKGIDNSMAALSFAVNKPLNNAMKAGTMRFLVELAGYQGEGKPFSLRLYYGNLAPGSRGNCNWLTTPCTWLVTQQSMGPDCKPLADFENAVIKNGKLTAGGKDEIFALEANLAGSVKPTFWIKGATIEADIELDPTAGLDKPKITKLDGVIGGVMTEVAVMTVFNALPEANFKPLDKKAALALVKQLLVLDIDVDGDGTKDAASLGIRIEGIGANIIGMSL